MDNRKDVPLGKHCAASFSETALTAPNAGPGTASKCRLRFHCNVCKHVETERYYTQSLTQHNIHLTRQYSPSPSWLLSSLSEEETLASCHNQDTFLSLCPFFTRPLKCHIYIGLDIRLFHPQKKHKDNWMCVSLRVSLSQLSRRYEIKMICDVFILPQKLNVHMLSIQYMHSFFFSP